MAYYKYSQFLKPLDHAEFDEIRGPGTTTGWSGLYRCEGCGKEVVSTSGHPLPPQNHHQHTQGQGQNSLAFDCDRHALIGVRQIAMHGS
jgi:hypothetical protein